MNDHPSYADRWIAGYAIAMIIALFCASLPGTAPSSTHRNPSSWAYR
jgi:hypothetical protein